MTLLLELNRMYYYCFLMVILNIQGTAAEFYNEHVTVLHL